MVERGNNLNSQYLPLCSYLTVVIDFFLEGVFPIRAFVLYLLEIVTRLQVHLTMYKIERTVGSSLVLVDWRKQCHWAEFEYSRIRIIFRVGSRNTHPKKTKKKHPKKPTQSGFFWVFLFFLDFKGNLYILYLIPSFLFQISFLLSSKY